MKHSVEEHQEEKIVHDESNWLVSYADMMTLLFGFFVLMYSLTRVDQDKFDVVRKELTKYFGGNIKENPAYMKVEEKVREIVQGSGLQEGVEIIRSGDETITLKFNNEILFPKGATELNEHARKHIASLIQGISSNAKIDQLEVEGHTDADPISHPVIKSNWELSSLRASSVVRYLEELGIDPAKMMAIGYGQSQPEVPHFDSSGNAIEANKSKNRRVVVHVKLKSYEEAKNLEMAGFKKKLTPEELEHERKKAELESKLKNLKQRFELVRQQLKERQQQEKRAREVKRLEEQIHSFQEKLKDASANQQN